MIKYLINRPVAVTAIFISVLVIGIYGWIKIPVSLLPDADPPEISIEVRKNGYSAEVMERTVVGFIRQGVIGSYGLKDVASEATQGFGRITLSYEFGTNMDLALIEINEKIDRIISNIPSEVERPIVKKKKPSDIPVLFIHLESKVFSISELSQLVRFELAKRFEQLEGVAQIEANGLVQKSIRLVPKTDKIMAAGLDLSKISRLIERSNLPVGQVLVRDGNYEYLVQIENLIRDTQSLESLIIQTPNGQQVELEELFDISDHYLNPLNKHLFNGNQGIAIAIYNQPKADLYKLQKDLLKTFSQIKREFPAILFRYSQDQINLLRQNIDQLYITSGLAALFALIVFFISSKSRKLPLILGTVVPSSVLISIGVLWMLGFTLNIITLSGFILGIGLLVDNVIIIIEEINQNRSAGLSVKEACVRSVQHMFPPLVSSTLTTICVFIPLLAIGGISSELFKEQAIALIIVLVVSLTLALILIPTYYSLWIKKEVEDLRWLGKFRANAHKSSAPGQLALTLLIVLAGGYSAVVLTTENLPEYQASDFNLRIIWNEPISLAESTKRVLDVTQELNSEFHSADLGISDITRNELNFFDEAKLYVDFGNRYSDALRDSLVHQVAIRFPKATVAYGKAANPFEMIFYTSQPMAESRIRKNTGSFFTKPELEKLLTIPASGALNVDLKESYKITFRNERVQNSSIAYPVLLDHLKNLTDEHVITSLNTPDQSIPISMTNDEMDYFIRLDSTYLDLSTFYRIKDTVEVRTIHADLSGPYISYTSTTMEDAVRFGKSATETNDWIYDIQGQLLNTSKSIWKLILAGILGIVLLYLILVAQFESFIQPLIIFSIIPLALLSCLIGLYLFGGTLNIMSIIGIVVTLGIIVNDSILKIDAINRNIKAGLGSSAAIKKAKDERFKPIVMTSLSTVLAMFPVLLASGIASDLQKPLAIVVICGLVAGTWSSISLLPRIYGRVVGKS